ncbi:tetratricopeptide repeat protein [Nocardioides sp.]|jgi:predicted Zn-dependent protease|uniref:tetratricopeptide repeat protein n=1 Tax=Nocardioides sp. TaxID=35761 RepID=UPI002630D45B|nr:tetratricopeptide repeat protein [Nocardioides sp.]
MSDFTAPSVTFSPGFGAETSTYRTAHGLLASRAPREALELLDPAIAADPSDRGLRSLRAWAYLIRVQLQKAEAELRGLVEDDPGDTWARYALGRALERQSRLADALPHYRLAAAMSGDVEHEVAVLRVERLLMEPLT